MLAVDDYYTQSGKSEFLGFREGLIQKDGIDYTRLIYEPRTKINEFELEKYQRLVEKYPYDVRFDIDL